VTDARPPRVRSLYLVIFLPWSGGACSPSTSPDPAADDAGSAGPSATLPAEIIIEGAAPLISDADVDLTLPAAIDVDGAGNVWIADRTLHRLLVVSPAGEVLHTIGRAGGGPGEFRVPRGLAIRGDYAWVLDTAHGVQRFDMSGAYVDEYDPALRALWDLDFTGDGGLLLSTNRVWASGGLVALAGPGGAEPVIIGELLFPDIESFNLRDSRDAILAREIPAALRNGARPVAAPDGTLWVAVHTEAVLLRYGADGALISRADFELPELPAIEARYFEDFRDLPVGDAFFFPSYIAAGAAVGDHLFLLWENVPGTPGLITVHGGDGALVQRWLLPEIDMGGGGLTVLSMALDAARRRLYVGVSDIATIFRVDLPESALPSAH